MTVGGVGEGDAAAGREGCSPAVTGEQLDVANMRRSAIRLPDNSERSTEPVGISHHDVDIARRVTGVVRVRVETVMAVERTASDRVHIIGSRATAGVSVHRDPMLDVKSHWVAR